MYATCCTDYRRLARPRPRARRALARDGWTLIIDARGAEALEAARAELAKQTTVIAIPGDVTDAAHRAALAAAARRAGGLDALVNNASILGPSPQPALLDYPLDALEQVYRTNVIAPLALIQAAARERSSPARASSISPATRRSSLRGLGRLRLEQGRARTTLAHPGRRESRRGASTGSTPAICARRCTRTRSPARTSATARCRRRACPACSRC